MHVPPTNLFNEMLVNQAASFYKPPFSVKVLILVSVSDRIPLLVALVKNNNAV